MKRLENDKQDEEIYIPNINIYQVDKISYSINADINLPPDLRQNTYYHS